MNALTSTRLRPTTFAAIALAFASLGDAFLYPFLPVNFSNVGVSVAWIGVLLSINRFVRILSNALVLHTFARYGLRTIMIVAAVAAIISTTGYAIASGIMAWLAFRIMWGLAFSAMRIGTLAYALAHDRQGLALGLSRGVQEAGPMMALLVAPLLLISFNSHTIFFLLAVLSIPALYFAWKLPNIPDRTTALKSMAFMRWPSSLNFLTLISAILIDGILIVTLGMLFLKFSEAITPFAATTLAALFLAYRRICLVILSTAGGWIADQFGLNKIFTISTSLVVMGLILIVLGWVGTGALVVFAFYSVSSAITPGSFSKAKEHTLAAVAENATWRDLGAALGTLLGGFLISSEYLIDVLTVVIFVMSITVFVHAGVGTRRFKMFSYGSRDNL